MIDVYGGNKTSQAWLTDKFPRLHFETTADMAELSEGHGDVLAYTVRNILWNKSDHEVVECLKAFVSILEQQPQTSLLLNEMLSPAIGVFEGDLEHAYRRRDVTVMTMHNAKQRTEAEWRALFVQATQT
jgi:hypothetical protein